MLYRHGLGGLFAVLVGLRTELFAMMRLVIAACIVFAWTAAYTACTPLVSCI